MSLYFLIAQIGVALAGFAGIVGALAGEKLRPSDPEVWLPFWVMISSGLSIVFAALFPFLPFHLGAPYEVSWAASSAFVTVITACNLAFFSPRFQQAQRAGVLARRFAFDLLFYLTSFFLLVSQVLNTLGIGLHQSVGGFPYRSIPDVADISAQLRLSPVYSGRATPGYAWELRERSCTAGCIC